MKYRWSLRARGHQQQKRKRLPATATGERKGQGNNSEFDTECRVSTAVLFLTLNSACQGLGSEWVAIEPWVNKLQKLKSLISLSSPCLYKSLTPLFCLYYLGILDTCAENDGYIHLHFSPLPTSESQLITLNSSSVSGGPCWESSHPCWNFVWLYLVQVTTAAVCSWVQKLPRV